jgi:hypothetical protein
MTTLLLIHGGMWQEGMDPGRFWHKPGIAAGLSRAGFEVVTPARLKQAPGWAAEALSRPIPAGRHRVCRIDALWRIRARYRVPFGSWRAPKGTR